MKVLKLPTIEFLFRFHHLLTIIGGLSLTFGDKPSQRDMKLRPCTQSMQTHKCSRLVSDHVIFVRKELSDCFLEDSLYTS